MSQDLCFYKQKIFPEQVCQVFTHKEVHSALKALLKNRDLEEELRRTLFEEVDNSSIFISAYDKRVEKLFTSRLFLSPQSRFFMVNQKILSVIHTVVESKKEELKNSHASSEELAQLSTDYSTLVDLFDKKLLFVNLQ